MATVWPEPYASAHSDFLDRTSGPFQALALHYDLTHINLHHLMSKAILGLPGERACQSSLVQAAYSWSPLKISGGPL